MQFLVYSKYCKYSLQLIDELEKVPQIADSLTPMCIDPDSSGKLPENFIQLQNFLTQNKMPTITKVPTFILGNEKEVVILSGADAFNWLKKVSVSSPPPPPSQPKVLEGINPNEMMSFSDSYALLNSDEVSNQSYQFINRQLQSIPTIEEQAIDNKEQFCQEKYEELLKERERM